MSPAKETQDVFKIQIEQLPFERLNPAVQPS